MTAQWQYSADDRARIKSEVSRRCLASNTRTGVAMTTAQIDAAGNLAVQLYETAAIAGVDEDTANSVTSFIAAAIDGIWARDRRGSI